MVSFWQLSGPDSHFIRDWRVTPGHPIGDAKIAFETFRSLSRKHENGEEVIDLVLGIEISGASHILIPENEHIRRSLSGLTWRNKKPYPVLRFASLSPLTVGREQFCTLLEDRQKVSKATAASKNKGDNSKANSMFWNGPPRPARAAFEHGRCFWKIIHRELRPRTYGLPNAPWICGINIISLAMTFWSPDGTTFLDAGITLLHLPQAFDSHEAKTWYFKSKDSEVLYNASKPTKYITPVTWSTVEVDNNDKASIGVKIQDVLETYSSPRGSAPAPLILLVHDWATVMDKLAVLGVQTTTWKQGLGGLLGYGDLSSQSRTQQLPFPPVGSTRELSSRKASSPPPVHSYAPVYIVDTMMMFQTITGSANHISPVDVFNKVTCNNVNDDMCGGSDAHYIMQSWKAMVAGTSIDEQRTFLKEAGNLQDQRSLSTGSGLQATPDVGLYEVEASQDLFNDGSDSEDDY